MNLKSCLICGAAALAALGPASVAHAQLMLSGQLHGEFQTLSPGDRGYNHTTVNNGGDVSTFVTGVGADGSGPTELWLTRSSFTDAMSGDVLASDFLRIFNGRTLIPTTADHATLDLHLDLENYGLLHLSTVTLWIENTPNGEGAVPDEYYLSFTPPPSITIGDTRVTFDLSFPGGFAMAPGATIAERTFADTGELSVHFTPIPEPSTYAAMGALLLGGVIAARRLRRQRAASAATPPRLDA